MNESETRAEYIDPMLKASGWGDVEGSRILREFRITEGKIQTGGKRSKPEIADYILVYKNRKIAVIEAKAVELPATEGLAQAKSYAEKLHIDYTYSTNGKELYQISMKSGQEGEVKAFPTPDELWNKTFFRSKRMERKVCLPFLSKATMANVTIKSWQSTTCSMRWLKKSNVCCSRWLLGRARQLLRRR